MKCKKISLSNFRNIKNANVSFCAGTNIITGDNAQGKTNLLEAIYFSALTKSFRTSHEAELVNFDAESADISLDFSDELRDQNISATLFKNHKKILTQNKVKITRSSDIVGQFKIVLFCPEHLSLIKDGPAMRRSYLDIVLSQLKPLYLHSLQKYNKILKQRNTLIKAAEDDRSTFNSTIEFWSEQLAHEAAFITAQRVRFIKKVREYSKDLFLEMTLEREQPGIDYISSSKLGEDEALDVSEVEKRYVSLLTSSLEREIGAGMTLYGAHRDDIDITLNGKSGRFYASQGQQRSLSLSLKLAEGEIIRDETGEHPVFLFDDVLSELDTKRRTYLTEKIKDKQVIMTTCELSNLTREANIISVKDGEYEQG